MLNNPNLYVIPGGPGSGKTIILQELEKFGFPRAPEVRAEFIVKRVQQT